MGTRSQAAAKMMEEAEPDEEEDISVDTSDDPSIQASITDDGSAAQGAQSVYRASKKLYK